MSFLKSLFGRDKKPEPAVQVEELDAPCPHVALVPHWASADDMGKTEKVERYTCEGCGQEFSREEGAHLLAAEKERLEKVLGEEG